MDEESSESIYLDNHVKKLISELDENSKKIFVTSLFKILYVSDVDNYRDAMKNKKSIVKNIFKLKREEKKLFNKIIFKGMIRDSKIRKMLISILKEKTKID